MKIALLVPGGVDQSGRERVIPALLWYIERLARTHEVHVFATHQYEYRCTYNLLGATVHNLAFNRFLLAPHRLGQFVRSLQHAGKFGVLHGMWGLPHSWLTVAAGKLLRIPSVIGLVGGELVGLREIGFGAQLHWRGRLLARPNLRLANAVVVWSHFMHQLALPFGVSPHIIPLGVPREFAARPKSIHPNNTAKKLLHIASLNKVKDQTTLLNAMRLVANDMPHVQLDIVGEDILNGEMQALCRMLQLESQVRFHGFLPNDALEPFWRDADLFVLPSRHDASPVVVLEAAMRGVPTVGTNVGYVKDWSPQRAFGVPVGDVPALARGMVRLLRDDAQRLQLGQAAQQWAMQHDADWSVREYERLYENLNVLVNAPTSHRPLQ